MSENSRKPKGKNPPVMRKPIPKKQEKPNSQSLMNVLAVVTFIMVLIIFFRGFNIKSTVDENHELTNQNMIELIDETNKSFETKFEIMKNEVLSSYALYSRLSAEELKEKEQYHKEQQEKWENVAKSQVTKYDLNKLKEEIKKDTTNGGNQ